ncbi:hypothetical protein AAG906_008481 [Vitis piasezkii]
MEERPMLTMSNSLDMDDPDRFDQIVNETMVGLIEKATHNSSERDMFEAGEANFNRPPRYMAWCKQGARILVPTATCARVVPFLWGLSSYTTALHLHLCHLRKAKKKY